MKNHNLLRPLLLVTALVLSISLMASPIRPVHAAGTLYINPPSITGAVGGTSITAQVKVAGIDPFNGWNVFVQTDPSVLKPTSIAISNILCGTAAAATGPCTTVPGNNTQSSPAVFELSNCVNGITGSGCGTGDAPGVAHSAVAASGSAGGNGLLFTITYSVTAVNSPASTSISIVSEAIKLGGSTVSVTIVNGSASTIPPAGFSFSPAPAPLAIPAGAADHTTINLNALGGFSGSVMLTVSGTPALVSTMISPNPVSLSTTATATLTVVTATGTLLGTFAVTIQGTGTSGSTTSTKTTTVSVTVFAPPVFIKGKLSWTHHLSLSKATPTNAQSWSALVTNPDASHSVDVRVEVTNWICLIPCVNPPTNALSGILTLPPGANGFLGFNEDMSNFVFNKVCFTGFLLYGAGQTGVSPIAKSGCFAVTP
jgi:hypothetical protein